jgi:hypothetical protein
MRGEDMTEPRDNGKETQWLDKSKNINKIWWALLCVTLVLCIADFFYHKHTAFKPGTLGAEIDQFWASYAVIAFLISVGIVLIAKFLRKILMRSDDYYGASDE